MIDQGRHSIVPLYAQGSKKVYYYNFYYLQAGFFCCGLGIPALCEELNRTNHWHKNTPYSTLVETFTSVFKDRKFFECHNNVETNGRIRICIRTYNKGSGSWRLKKLMIQIRNTDWNYRFVDDIL
jgi:hypothetical protein